MPFPRLRPQEQQRHVVVTTFHEKGYRDYGKRCIESFLRYWPEDVSLLVYAEGVHIEETDGRLQIFDQSETLPRLLEFRKTFGENPLAQGIRPSSNSQERNFLWDAVRFSNKVYAVTDAIRRCRTAADHLIWLDADTVTHRGIPHRLLERVAPRGDQLAAYLNRKIYPECGWVGYNLLHDEILTFAERFEDIYGSGHFLAQKESHDSFLFWKIVQQMERDGEARFKFLGSNLTRSHVFLNSILGKYMDHLKGDRKATGKSLKSDLRWRRRPEWLK
jgi:hypothetical protein